MQGDLIQGPVQMNGRRVFAVDRDDIGPCLSEISHALLWLHDHLSMSMKRSGMYV